jgi:SAM-dependent methyltransferase
VRPCLDKRTFYSQPEISDTYDQQRFGGASGARVNARELEIALAMLPSGGRVLDLACGTGRLSQAIAARGQSVVGIDYSPPMAVKTASLGVPTAVADAFATPFISSAFDAVVSLRFTFHWPDLRALLAEMQRVAKPGAPLVFDTYTWSPRSAIALGQRRWGARVYPRRPHEVAGVARTLDLRIDEVRPCFLFSPYLYRLAPLPLERAFESLERRVPRSWLCRVFWKLGTRNEASGTRQDGQAAVPSG